MATTRQQLQYRIRTDANAANTGTPTWGAALNTTFFPGLDTPFRIRFTCQNTGSTTPSGATQVIRYSLNGGAYTAVTTSTTPVKAIDATAGTSADNSSIATANFRLGAGSGSAIAGQYDDTGATASFVLTATSYTEFEFGLQINSAGVNNADTLAFEVYSSTTAYNTYTQIPTITVQKAATATLSSTEAADTITATAVSVVGGALSATEAADTISAVAGLVVGASLSSTDDADTVAASAGPVVGGSLSTTEDDDTLSAAADVVVDGALTAIEASDTLSATASVVVAGVLSTVEDEDTVTAVVGVTVEAVLSTVEDSDILVATGTVGSIVDGSLSEVEDDDVMLVGYASVVDEASLSDVEDDDVLGAVGTVISTVAVLNAIEDPDFISNAVKSGGVPMPRRAVTRNPPSSDGGKFSDLYW